MNNTDPFTSGCSVMDRLTFVLTQWSSREVPFYEEMQEVCVYVYVCVEASNSTIFLLQYEL